MPIMARDNKKEYAQAEEGLHQAVCCDVVDLGDVQTSFGLKHKVRIKWQTEAINQEDGKPFQITNMYTLSLNEKANLRKHLECWRGRKFTPDELSGFDLEKLIDVNCQLQIIHNITDEGKTYANIQAIIPLGKGMPKIGVKEYTREKDREKTQDTNGKVEITDDDIPF
jgi:hypothetical protein